MLVDGPEGHSEGHSEPSPRAGASGTAGGLSTPARPRPVGRGLGATHHDSCVIVHTVVAIFTEALATHSSRRRSNVLNVEVGGRTSLAPLHFYIFVLYMPPVPVSGTGRDTVVSRWAFLFFCFILYSVPGSGAAQKNQALVTNEVCVGAGLNAAQIFICI